MVEGEQVFVAHGLGRLSVVPNDDRVGADLDLWKDDADLHCGFPPVYGVVFLLGGA